MCRRSEWVVHCCRRSGRHQSPVDSGGTQTQPVHTVTAASSPVPQSGRMYTDNNTSNPFPPSLTPSLPYFAAEDWDCDNPPQGWAGWPSVIVTMLTLCTVPNHPSVPPSLPHPLAFLNPPSLPPAPLGTSWTYKSVFSGADRVDWLIWQILHSELYMYMPPSILLHKDINHALWNTYTIYKSTVKNLRES